MPDSNLMVVYPADKIVALDPDIVFISGVLAEFDQNGIQDPIGSNPFAGKSVKKLHITTDSFIYLNFDGIIETSIGVNDPNVNFLRATNIVIPSAGGAESFCVPFKVNPNQVSKWFPIRDIKFVLAGLNQAKVTRLTGTGSDELTRFINEFEGQFQEIKTPSGAKIKFQDDAINSEFRRFVEEAHR